MLAPILHQLRRYAPFIALAVGVSLGGLMPAADGDIWWHLAAGREMVARHELLRADPFSISAAGRPWVDVHWLFQLAAYAVHHAFGLTGLVWAKCAALVVGAFLLGAALGRRGRTNGSYAAFVTLLLAALFSARSLLLLRPVIVTLLCLATFLFVLEAARRRGATTWLWALIGVQVAWANFQGLSALGPAVVAAYAIAAGASTLRGHQAWPFALEAAPGVPESRYFKALLVAFVGCCLACGATPFGTRALVLPLELARRLAPGHDNVYSSAVAENVPPYVLERVTGGEFWHLKWALGILALAMLLAGRRLRLSHALLLLGFTALALSSNRNVLLLYWVAAPLTASYLAPRVRCWLRAKGGAATLTAVGAVNGAVVCAILGTAGIAAARETSLAEPAPFRVPVESAARLARLPAGNVFAADHQGGYVIWRLFPRFRPYVDSRWVLRTADEFQEYLGLSESPSRFDAFRTRQQLDYVVLPTAYPDRYLGLIAHLYRSADWKLLHTEGSEVLFGRSDSSPEPGLDLGRNDEVQHIIAEIDRRYAAPELRTAARVQLARLLAALGELAQAERALEGLGHTSARALRARLRFASGDSSAAERLARQALADDQADVRSLSLLGRIALHRGQATLGADFLKRALATDPFDPEAGELLTQMQENDR